MNKKSRIFSRGITVIITATAVDFFAWGLIDPFFSTFARDVLQNLFLVGILISCKGLSGLLFLAPLSQVLHVKSPRIVSLIGRMGSTAAIFLYALGGITFTTWILFLGSFLHGIAGSARDVSTRDYLMTQSPKKYASTILGTNFSVRYGAWMTASIISGFLIVGMSLLFHMPTENILPYAFLISIPFFLSSFFLLQTIASNDKPFPYKAFLPKAIFLREKNLLQKFCNLHIQVKFSISLIMFLQIVRSALLLFLPLMALDMNLSIEKVGILIAFMYAPLLLSAIFSIFEDKAERMLFVIGGLLFASVPLLLLSQVDTPLHIGFLAVLTSLSIAVIMPANLGNIAANTKRSEAAHVSALQIISQRMGMLVGAFCIGTVSQLFGIQSAFLVIALLAITFAIFAIIVRRKFKHEEKTFTLHQSFTIHPLHPQLYHNHHSDI